MEIDQAKGYIYSDTELDRAESEQIEALKVHSQEVIPDPDKWLDEELQRNILLTTVDIVLNWARRSSLWPAICFPACCAFELIAANASRFDLARFGMEILRASPRQADLMIAPQVKRIYEQMAEPKWVIAMGACGISGGIFRSSYNVVPGYNRIVPVDVYIPGCPPRPEALIYGIRMLHNKISKEHTDIVLPPLRTG